KRLIIKRVQMKSVSSDNDFIVIRLQLVNFFKKINQTDVYFEHDGTKIEVDHYFDKKIMNIKIPHAVFEQLNGLLTLHLVINNQPIWVTPIENLELPYDLYINGSFYTVTINQNILIRNETPQTVRRHFPSSSISAHRVKARVESVAYNTITCHIH